MRERASEGTRMCVCCVRVVLSEIVSSRLLVVLWYVCVWESERERERAKEKVRVCVVCVLCCLRL